MREITAAELKQKLDAGESITLIDVREPYEHEEFNIGGTNIPLAELTLQTDTFKSLEDTEIVFYCRSGNRSAMAQKLLAMHMNLTDTSHLKGGIIAWKDAGL
jgi:rhodanese-related sulfurtransferase